MRWPRGFLVLLAASFAAGVARGDNMPGITGERLLRTYAELFGLTDRAWEVRRAPRLRGQLEATVTAVRLLLRDPPFPGEELTPGWRAAQRALGPALIVLGTPVGFLDPAVREEAAQTAAKHAASDAAGQYRAAVALLRDASFDPRRNEDLSAMLLLGYGMQQAGLASVEGFRVRSGDSGVTDAWTQLGGSPWRPDEGGWKRQLDAARQALGSDPKIFHVLAPEAPASAGALRWQPDVPAAGTVSVDEGFRQAAEALLAPPDPDAPAFAKTAEWQAQRRRVAELWAGAIRNESLPAEISGTDARNPLVIEPSPIFLRRYVALVQATEERFEESGAFEVAGPAAAVAASPSPSLVLPQWTPLREAADVPHLRRRWRDLERVSARLEVLAQEELRGRAWTEEESAFLSGALTSLAP